MPSARRQFPPGAAARGGAAAAVSNRKYADEHYAPLYGLLARLRAEGLSLAAIAAELNARGEKTRLTAGPWNPTQVGRVLARGQRLRQQALASAGDAAPPAGADGGA
jgi:hypothetical protein